ncbi:MAG: sugar phosphate isomerase/epimerase family protein [Thermoguttaceae bacterium]
MNIGYNTNGFAHHDLFDAVALLAEIGYRGVAVTIDHTALPPYASYASQRTKRLRRRLEQLGLRSVIETGARFLLNPRHKHEPTLVSRDPAGRARRLDFYKYAVDCAAELHSDCVSLWSGALPADVSAEQAWPWLVEGLGQTLDYAAARGVTVALEPEPGMLVDRTPGFENLTAQLGRSDLGLTLDIGHLHCQGELPIAAVIRQWGGRLVNVHVEDMRAGRHEHLMFGEGEIDFPPVFRALAEARYGGGVYVELSRHSHQAPETARRAFEFLSPMAE